MTKIYNSSQGLSCSNFRCQNEAKWIRNDFEPKVKAESVEDYEDRVRENVKCGTHGPSVESRRRYGRITGYVAITPEQREAGIRSVARKEAAQEADRASKADENHQKARDRAARMWTELDIEGDLVVIYEETSDWSKAVTRQWSAYTPEQVAAGRDDVPLERMFNAVITVKLNEDVRAYFDDVTNPAYIETHHSSNLSAKEAQTLANMLALAIPVLTAANVARRGLHNAQVSA